jgi:hypothetical protein
MTSDTIVYQRQTRERGVQESGRRGNVYVPVEMSIAADASSSWSCSGVSGVLQNEKERDR